MKTLLALGFLILPHLAWAQKAGGQSVESLRLVFPREAVVTPPRPAVEKGILAMAGLDMRNRQNEEQRNENVMSPNLALGYMWSNWIGSFEYGFHDSSTGNAALAVERRTERMMLWGHWQATDNRFVTPFLGLGIGNQRETVKTTLLGIEDVDHSGTYWMSGASLGLRFLPKTRLWMSAEGRLYKNSHEEPDPQLGLLLRIGFRI